MGMGRAYLEFWDRTVAPLHVNQSRLHMLELGNQVIDSQDVPFYQAITGKQLFENRGYTHTSVDWNGHDGALVKDLRDPAQFTEWHNKFDVVTNFGTTEHVEPVQFQHVCWNILHDVGKPGCTYIHVLPDVHERDHAGAWVGHCPIYYDFRFFRNLAEQNGYEILGQDIIQGCCAVAYRKPAGNSFKSSLHDILRTLYLR